MTRDTEAQKSFADVLAEHGRPIAPERLQRAAQTLAAARERRDPEARAALRARLDAA